MRCFSFPLLLSQRPRAISCSTPLLALSISVDICRTVMRAGSGRRRTSSSNESADDAAQRKWRELSAERRWEMRKKSCKKNKGAVAELLGIDCPSCAAGRQSKLAKQKGCQMKGARGFLWPADPSDDEMDASGEPAADSGPTTSTCSGGARQYG